VAAAIGIGALAPWAGVGASARNARQARRGGAAGILLAAMIGVGAAIAAAPAAAGALGPAAGGIRSGVLALAGVALASAGALGATRALASAAPGAFAAPGALASQRLAAARGGALGLIGVCGALLAWRAIDPAIALTGAIILSLTFVAPAFGLSFSPRATSRHAVVGVTVSLAALVALAAPGDVYAFLANWAPISLAAAALGFALGWAASLFGRPGTVINPEIAGDAFLGPPESPGG
jgi:hypothetical protein